MNELDVLGTILGTDKGSAIGNGWDYLRHYEQLFARFKMQKINLIEIGVLDGSSIETWRMFFPNATIVGIDIQPRCARFAGERVAIRIGSQENPEFLQSVAKEFPPTIVIDDGSHLAHHMITSFETLFPALASGGIYVFEDLPFHFEESKSSGLELRLTKAVRVSPYPNISGVLFSREWRIWRRHQMHGASGNTRMKILTPLVSLAEHWPSTNALTET